jgi:hypothetical protein
MIIHNTHSLWTPRDVRHLCEHLYIFLDAKQLFCNLIVCYIKRYSSPTTHLLERGGTGCIAPTHSRPRHWMGWVVSVTPRPRSTPGERISVSTVQEAGWAPEPVWTRRLQKEISFLCRRSDLDRPVVQPVARHYTDWATRLTVLNCI